MSKVYQITPVAKCRQTQRDKWMSPPRPAVARYRAFKDKIREMGVILPESGAHVIFRLPMPKSWSKKKCREMMGKPHKQKKDVDNLLKALLDAIFIDDAHIWDIRITKKWADTGFIEIITEEEFK